MLDRAFAALGPDRQPSVLDPAIVDLPALEMQARASVRFLTLCAPSPTRRLPSRNLSTMQFRHPEQLDRQRFHHDLSDGGPLNLHRSSENLLALLVILSLVCLLAVASLAAAGASLRPFAVILIGFAALLLGGNLARTN